MKCKCSLSTSVLGDGCRHCQPQTHIDYLEHHIEDLKAENELMYEALKGICSVDVDVVGFDEHRKIWKRVMEVLDKAKGKTKE